MAGADQETFVNKPNSDEPQSASFDAEWEQFESELQGGPVKEAPAPESSAISYPNFQNVKQSEGDVYSASFQMEQIPDGQQDREETDNSVDEQNDDSAAYSPSSEPILDLFSDSHPEAKPVNEERSAHKSDAGSVSSHRNESNEKRKDDKSSRLKHHGHSKSRSRSRSRDHDRSHRSKSKQERYHSHHRHSKDRDHRHKHHRSSSNSRSSSSRSRSRSSDDRHHRSHHSPDRRRRDDDRKRDRHSDRRHHEDRSSGGLSTATVGNYGPRSAEQMEKQRQLNAAVLNQKQTTKRVGKNKTFIPNRSGQPRPESGQEAPSNPDESGAPQPPKNFGGFSKKKQFDPKLTPQERAALLQKHVEDATGIQMPKYYNPTAINPLKYAQQMQKRKLLWSKAKEGKSDNESLWQNTAMALDSSSSNKFQKLMGLKSTDEPAPEAKQPSVSVTVADCRRKQDQLFDQLDREYEFARMSTHTHRGMGLGFQSAAVEKATLIASVNASSSTSSKK